MKLLHSQRNPTYVTWRSMVGRCTNPKFDNYKRYGAIGVTIDNRWLVFENFVEDMGDRPEKKTLDRIDSNIGYTKNNCRWATPAEQQRNRKCAMLITYNGITKNSSDWSTELGLVKSAVWMRIKKGWSIERAVTTRKRG